MEKWSEDDKNAAIEMSKTNANVFSKNDMDMGRTNLVKHHIKLTDPIPFKESYRRIPPQIYDEVKAHIQEMLDLGAIRHSNSPLHDPGFCNCAVFMSYTCIILPQT